MASLSDVEMDAANYARLQSSISPLYFQSKAEVFQGLLGCKLVVDKLSVILSDIRVLVACGNVGEDFIRMRFIEVMPERI